ncbi:MAG: hypothetical protein ACLU38_13490 [Dysosmobacter sp.]
MSKDVTLTATATEIAKLAQDGAATASTDGKTITVKFNRDIADGATLHHRWRCRDYRRDRFR